MIDWRPSHTDDFVYNRAGTIHAIGGGLTIVEVQQNVDCTYRLYDYGRPRELHLDEGLKVANPGRAPDPRDTCVDPPPNRQPVGETGRACIRDRRGQYVELRGVTD